MINIKNKNGELSIYGLSCGYMEQKRNKSNWVVMFIEHAHIHIQAGKNNHKYTVWETLQTNELTKARKRINELLKQKL